MIGEVSESGSTPKRKTPHTAWAKGQSGNPSGRKKGAFPFRQMCRELTGEKLWFVLVQEVLDKGEHWFEAAKLLIAYGYGKPTEKVEIEGQVNVFAQVSDEKLLAFIDANPLPEEEAQLALLPPPEETSGE